jgi:hypothetical protein
LTGNPKEVDNYGEDWLVSTILLGGDIAGRHLPDWPLLTGEPGKQTYDDSSRSSSGSEDTSSSSSAQLSMDNLDTASQQGMLMPQDCSYVHIATFLTQVMALFRTIIRAWRPSLHVPHPPRANTPMGKAGQPTGQAQKVLHKFVLGGWIPPLLQGTF